VLTDSKLLAAAFNDREGYETLLSQNLGKQLTPATKVVWDQIEQFYEKDPEAKNVDREIILSQLRRKYRKEETFNTFRNVINSFDNISLPNVLSELRQFRIETVANKIAERMSSNEFDKADSLVEQYQELRSADLAGGVSARIVQAPKILSLDEVNKSNVKLLPHSLNRHIGGGVPKSSSILVFARPEMGKTAMIITMVNGFLHQGLRVLYVGNEEAGDMVNARVIASLTDNTIENCRKRTEKAHELAVRRGYNNYFFHETDAGNAAELEEGVVERKADVLIVDQLRNVKTREDTQTAAYENLGRFVRTLSKKHNILVLSAVQAGASAEGKVILDMNDVDGSKTGLAGSTDLMLGLGANDEMKLRREIMVTACRNKINGEHGGVKCQLDPLKAKVW
jgi:archaellum biogenesis ATPase FlaH